MVRAYVNMIFAGMALGSLSLSIEDDFDWHDITVGKALYKAFEEIFRSDYAVLVKIDRG